MSREDILRKGQAAKSLLDSADFSIAMDAVRLQAYKGFAASAPEEAAKREENYYLLQAISRLVENLEALVANARVEEYNAKREVAEAEAKAGLTPTDEE